MSEDLSGSPMRQHFVAITSGSFENAAAEELARRRIVKARRCGSSSAAAFDNTNVRPLLGIEFERDKDFIASSMLKDEVEYVSDQVCFTLC